METVYMAIPQVPMQEWTQVYDLPPALAEGTIFPELNKPFYVAPENSNTTLPRTDDAHVLFAQVCFALDDALLYLDTHPEDAEECLYDSIMKIWEHIGSYDEAHPFAAWAATIAKYTALNRLRRLERIEPTVDITEMRIEDTAQLTADSDFNSFFAELTACLSDEDKLLFTRIFWLGQSPEEAARSMGKDRSVVYNRISRGKKKIMRSNPGYFRKEES